MELYVIETKENPLMIRGSASEETIKRYVERFPQELNVTYRKINLEQVKEIEEKIDGKLAEILIKKYRLTQNLKSLDEKLN